MKRSVAYSVLVLICLVAYGNCFGHGFLLDDHTVMFSANGLKSVDSYWSFFQQGFQGFYRPLGYMFLKAVNAVFQENPAGYHAVNWLLFAAVAVLFFEILNYVLKDPPTALIAAGLYAAHPINSMLVNYKTASSMVIYIILLQMSFWAFAVFSDKRKPHLYTLSLAGYFLSLLSHEVSFIFPVYLVLFLRFMKGNSWREALKACAPFAAVFLLYMLIRLPIEHLRPIEGLFYLPISIFEYTASIAPLVFWYISKLFLPVDVLFLQEGSLARSGILFWNIALAGAAILGVYLLSIRWRTGAQAFALALFLTGFIPAGLASFVYTYKYHLLIFEPHWFGFASIGFFLLAALGIKFFVIRAPGRARWISVAVLISVLALATRAGNHVWRHEQAYCAYWLRVDPSAMTPKKGLARAYIRANDKGPDPGQYQDIREVDMLIQAFELLGKKREAARYRNILRQMHP